MYNGTKRQTVPKGRGHVLYFHIAVMFTLYPTPLLESLQRAHDTVLTQIQVFLLNRGFSFVPGVTGGNTQSVLQS